MNPQLVKIVTGFKKQPISISCGLVCLALGVTDYFRSGLEGELEATKDEKTTEAHHLGDNVSKAAHLPDQYEALRAANQAAKERAVKPGNQPTNIQYFYRLEADSGIKILSVAQSTVPLPLAGAPPKIYIPVGYSLSFQGSFPKVLDFFRRLEHGAHFARVNTILVAGAPVMDRGDAKLTVNLNLELLGLPAAEAPPAGSAATDLVSVPARAATLELAQRLLATGGNPTDRAADEVKDPFNPPGFQSGSGSDAPTVPAVTPGGVVVSAQVASDRETLAKIAPEIGASGTFIFNGQPVLIISKGGVTKRLKVGDSVSLTFEGKSYEIFLAAIDGTNFTLRLNGEEVTRSINPAIHP